MTRVCGFCAVVIAALASTGCGSADRDPTPLEAIAYTRFVGSRYEVWLSAPDGSHKRKLARGRAPALAPDGRSVAYQGSCDVSGGCSDLFLVPASGGQAHRLAEGLTGIGWSADGDRLLAYRPGSNTTAARLYVLDRDGERVEVARGNLNGWSFSPRGDAVAYSAALGPRIDLFVVDADGRHRRRITNDGKSSFPVWTSHGILFSHLVPLHGWGAHEVWRIDANGGGRRSLSGPLPPRMRGSGINGLQPIAWRNESLLAALVSEFGASPYAVDARRHVVRTIGAYGARSWPDGLSRDGRRVLVETGNLAPDSFTRVEVIPFRGGRPRVIARFAGEASWNL